MSFQVLTFLTAGFIFILGFQTPVFAKKNKLTFCRIDSLPSNWLGSNTCPIIVNSKSTDLECVVGSDRIACLRLLLSDQADFMIAQPEDLMVIGMTESHSDKVLVTQELRVEKKDNWKYFKWVVVVRKNIKKIRDIEKKSYCAPDFEEIFFSEYYTRYFEDKLIIRECDPMKTLLENKMSTLSQYFESACISREWTNDYNMDMKLKKKYDNLCSQCFNSKNCSIGKTYLHKEHGSLCLIDQQSDIGWFSLSSIASFRESLQNLKGGSMENEFKYLCPDDTTKNLTTIDPCIWFQEPWQTIISRKEVAETVTEFMTEQSNVKEDFYTILKHESIRLPHPDKVEFLENFKTPTEYLQTGYPTYYSLKNHSQCEPKRAVKWCVTTNLEAQKCKWLSYAAQTYQVEPLINCVQEISLDNCIESVKKGKNDIFVIKHHEETKVRKNALKSIIHMVSTKHHANEIAAIIRKTTSTNSLMDLKNQTACFSSYRDAGWNSFIYAMKSLTGDKNWYCKDKEMVSQFFTGSCVADLSKENTTFPENLYSYCSQFSTNRFGEEKALSCLYLGADVAFVNLTTNINFYPDTIGKSSHTKPLCLNRTTNTNQEDNCYLAWKTMGSIMVDEKISQVREDEIYLMLIELDKLFGVQYRGPTPLISLYGPFDGMSDIIFPGETQHLERKVCPHRCSLNHEKILEEIKTQRQLCNEANFSGEQTYFIIFLFFIHFSTIWF